MQIYRKLAYSIATLKNTISLTSKLLKCLVDIITIKYLSNVANIQQFCNIYYNCLSIANKLMMC